MASETSPIAGGPRPRDLALAIESSKGGLRSETETIVGAGGIQIRLVRYFVGEHLVLVDETMLENQKILAAGAYYFDDGRLAFFRARGRRTFYDAAGTATSEDYEIELGFDADDKLVDSYKIIDGAPRDLEPLDIEAPKARARMLTRGPGPDASPSK